ncbi:MAG: class B sortase [Eubacterium sp.]
MKKKKFFWGIVLVVAMLVCIVSTTYIVLYFFSGNDNSEYIQKTSSTNTTGEIITATENHNLNWTKMQEDNSDIYAWIYIPNTNVDYAVVQPTDKEGDSFYLDRNLKKKYEFAGSIYSEMQNAKDFSDPVTILYGHNMLNGSMFASLHKFEDKNFFKKNKYMYIYMPNHKLTYKIYSAYVYDDRHILNSFDFSDNKVLENYLQYTLNPDSLNKNTRKADLNLNSKILTLSTCTSGASNTRYLVQGVLIKDEPTN